MSDVIITVAEEETAPVVIITPGETVVPPATIMVETQEEVAVVHITVDENSAQSAADSAAAAQLALEALANTNISGCIEKAEYAEFNMSGDAYVQFSIPQFSSLRFIADSTIFKGVYLFPGYKAYSGKKLTLKNFQTTDILLKHLDSEPLLNTFLYFPNENDYILKPGKIIEFSLSMIANRFEFIGDSEDVSGKEDASNKGIADGYAPLNSAIKIASEYLDIVNDLVTGGATSLASAETVKTLKNQINAINTLLTSDNVNLDTVQEIVDAIETVQTSLSTILVNDLSTGGITKALTAEQGKVLKALLDALTTTVGNKVNTSSITQDIETNKTSTSFIASVKQLYDWAVAKFVQIANIKTVNGNSLIGTGNVVTPDMDTTTAQPVSGVKTFLAGMFGLRNTANTFTSFFASAVTASRTWTLPDKNGTVAMTSDIVAQLSGTVNRLVKFGTSNTGANSRIEETGTFLGIGTTNTPTKDVTLGNQANRNIGVELSDSTTVGRDFIMSAGSTVNYQLSAAFVALGQTARNYVGFALSVANNICVGTISGDILVQTNGTGNFNSLGLSLGSIRGIGYDYSNNIYACTTGSGNIYKQTNATGSFVSLGQSVRNWYYINGHPNGNIYATVGGELGTGDIYMQTGGTGNFIALGQTARAWCGISCHINGNVYASVYGGDIYMQTGGAGNFVSLGVGNRSWYQMYIDRNNGNVYAVASGVGIYMQTGGVGSFTLISSNLGDTRAVGGSQVGNIYIGIPGGDIYMQNNNALGTSNLDGGTLIHESGAGKGTGNSNYEVWTGQKTVPGTDMQVLTRRMRIDNLGRLTRFGTPVYADNTAALTGGLTAGMEYRTATGVKMEVY
jgi:hypothetical protein